VWLDVGWDEADWLQFGLFLHPELREAVDAFFAALPEPEPEIVAEARDSEPSVTTSAPTTTSAVDTSYWGGASGYPSGNEPGFVNGYPCGGDLPPCSVLAGESGGNPHAVNWGGCGGNNCYGLWQFSGEWACDLGLPCDLLTATVEQQNAAARTLFAGGAGCGNWSATDPNC
jgi:hypothetical protein